MTFPTPLPDSIFNSVQEYIASRPFIKTGKISNLSRGISLGKARRKPISNSDVRISPIARTTPASRGRGRTATPVSSRTVNPGRIGSSRQPVTKSQTPTKPSSGGSKILENLIQIAGSKENNPVEKAAKVSSPSISPTVAKISSITPRRPINENKNQKGRARSQYY